MASPHLNPALGAGHGGPLRLVHIYCATRSPLSRCIPSHPEPVDGLALRADIEIGAMQPKSTAGICGPRRFRVSIGKRGKVPLATIGIVVLLSAILAPPAAAVPTPIDVSPLAVDFGDVAVGTTSPPMSVQVRNTSTSPFGPINMFGGAPPTAEFNAFQNCQGDTLAGGASCQITYEFSPGSPGSFSDSSTFTISQTSSQSDGEDFSVALTGQGETVVHHLRTITLKLRRHLVAKGRVSAADDFAECESGATVKVQRRRRGTWRTIGTDVTGPAGRYRESLPDRKGRYRAKVKKRVLNGGANVCRRDVSRVRRHSHG